MTAQSLSQLHPSVRAAVERQLAKDDAPKHQPAIPPIADTITDRMNKTEARYFQFLRSSGDPVLSIEFEAMTFRLGQDCRYTPDFMVVRHDRIEYHEVKGGYIREDAAVKIKAAASRWPWFVWYLAVWKDKRWTVKEVGT